MRTALLLGFASLIAVTSIACAVESPDTGTSEIRRSVKHPATGDDDDDNSGDPNPTIGAHDVDPGNPNASSTPTAPTTGGTAASSFALALDSNTPTVDLGKSVDLNVNVTPNGAFNGGVAITVDGLPDGVTASPATATVNGAAASVKLTLNAALTAPVSADQIALTIKGTANGQTATATANFKVNPKVTLTIPMNIAALKGAGTTYRDEWGDAFGSNPQNLLTQANNPIVVTVFNADSAAHIIHGQNGFAHGDTNNPIQPNSFEEQNGAPRIRSFKPGAQGTGYPHDFGTQGPGASFHMNVGSAP
jgi:hypothetical protein